MARRTRSGSLAFWIAVACLLGAAGAGAWLFGHGNPPDDAGVKRPDSAPGQTATSTSGQTSRKPQGEAASGAVTSEYSDVLEGASAQTVPRLEEVRHDANGLLVIAGRVVPGADIIRRLAGIEFTRVRADAAGAFATVATLETADVARVLTLIQVDASGRETISPDELILAPAMRSAAADPTAARDDQPLTAAVPPDDERTGLSDSHSGPKTGPATSDRSRLGSPAYEDTTNRTDIAAASVGFATDRAAAREIRAGRFSRPADYPIEGETSVDRALPATVRRRDTARAEEMHRKASPVPEPRSEPGASDAVQTDRHAISGVETRSAPTQDECAAAEGVSEPNAEVGVASEFTTRSMFASAQPVCEFQAPDRPRATTAGPEDSAPNIGRHLRCARHERYRSGSALPSVCGPGKTRYAGRTSDRDTAVR
jgi:hypothetical protein